MVVLVGHDLVCDVEKSGGADARARVQDNLQASTCSSTSDVTKTRIKAITYVAIAEARPYALRIPCIQREKVCGGLNLVKEHPRRAVRALPSGVRRDLICDRALVFVAVARRDIPDKHDV